MANSKPSLTPMEQAALARKQQAAQPDFDVVTDRSQLPPGVPAVPLPNFVPPPLQRLGDLDPAKQKEILESLDEVQKAAQSMMRPQEPQSEPAAPAPAPAAAPQAPPPAEAPAKPEEPKVLFCPNCGFRTDQDPVEVTLEDKKDYLRYTAAELPFEKEYVLLDGRMKIVMRELVKEGHEMINQQLLREIKDGRLMMNDITLSQSNYLYRRAQLCMAACLVRMDPGIPVSRPQIHTPEAAALWPPTEKDTVVAVAAAALFAGKPVSLIGITHRVFHMFEALRVRLEENAKTPGFYAEIVGHISTATPSPTVS